MFSKMPETKVIKTKPVEATRNSVQRNKPVKVKGAEAELRRPALRKTRGSSCPRRDRSDRSAASTSSTAACQRRTRSVSAAPKTPAAHWHKTNPPQHQRTPEPTHRGNDPRPGQQRDQRGVKTETKFTSQSHKAFTVIAPNPEKRREIQRKAEAELAALEELRLSRAMAFVSINPSSVGGCMSLEEVRLRQQQEMMQSRRKQKQMKEQVLEQTHVLTG